MLKKMMEQFGINTGEDFEIKERQKTKPPSLFKVYLLNDDYTTMEFVVHILENIFHKSSVEAAQIMLHVHKNGKGMAGIYTRGIAETKVAKVHELARQDEFPLKCIMEKE
jgi:ATP-dependent Clp protease adaptor protein ClpS